jgi:hypothetical protein
MLKCCGSLRAKIKLRAALLLSEGAMGSGGFSFQFLATDTAVIKTIELR